MWHLNKINILLYQYTCTFKRLFSAKIILNPKTNCHDNKWNIVERGVNP
jgi:hypothetical protein